MNMLLLSVLGDGVTTIHKQCVQFHLMKHVSNTHPSGPLGTCCVPLGPAACPRARLCTPTLKHRNLGPQWICIRTTHQPLTPNEQLELEKIHSPTCSLLDLLSNSVSWCSAMGIDLRTPNPHPHRSKTISLTRGMWEAQTLS